MSVDITCPHCQRLDLVQSVPALHAGGVSTSFGMSSYSGVGVASTGLVPIFGTATVERTLTTELARSLAREPAPQPTTRLTRVGVLLLIPALLALVPSVASLVIEDPQVPRWAALAAATFFVGAIASPGLLALSVAVVRSRRNRKIARGRRSAHAVWQAGFYCHRCGVAYWPHSPAPGIPARQAFTPHHFRWFVWNAGGYIHAA